MNEKDYQEIKKIVDDGIGSIINNATLPMCRIENARLEKLEEVIQKLSIIVVGNGHVEDSLLWKQSETEKSLNQIARIVDRRQPESKDSFQLILKYIADKILPSLLTAGILGLIAFLWALQQHVIVIP